MQLGTTMDPKLGMLDWHSDEGAISVSYEGAHGRYNGWLLMHWSGTLGEHAHHVPLHVLNHARKLWAQQRAKDTDFLHALIDAASERNPDDNPAELAAEARGELEELVKTIHAMAE